MVVAHLAVRILLDVYDFLIYTALLNLLTAIAVLHLHIKLNPNYFHRFVPDNRHKPKLVKVSSFF